MKFVTRSIGTLALSLMVLTGCATPAGNIAPAPVADPGPPLLVSGALTVVELAPVLLAVRDIYPDGTRIRMGGVPSLFGTPPADVATNAETQALRVSVKHPDVRIILTVAEGNYRIVARRSAGISKVADLKGKRVATQTLTSSGYFLSRMLATAGLSFDDIIVVQINPLQRMVTAIAGNEVDAVVIWEPHSENALRVLGADAIEFSGKGIYRELFNLNTTAGALADPVKRQRIVRLVRAIIDATRKIQRDPSEAQSLVAASGGYSLEEVQGSWKHHSFVASFAEDMLDVLEQEEIWLAGMEGRTPRSRAVLSTLIDRSVYAEALALPPAIHPGAK